MCEVNHLIEGLSIAKNQDLHHQIVPPSSMCLINPYDVLLDRKDLSITRATDDFAYSAQSIRIPKVE